MSDVEEKELLTSLADVFSGLEKFECKVEAFTVGHEAFVRLAKTNFYDLESGSLWGAIMRCDGTMPDEKIVLKPDTYYLERYHDGNVPQELQGVLEGSLAI